MKARRISSFGFVLSAGLVLLFGTLESQGITYSFADTLQSGGILLANGATMQGQLFEIGDGRPGPHNGDTDPNDVGGVYNGTVFDATTDADPTPSLVTRLSASPRWTVGEGYGTGHANAIGIYVSLSVPTVLQDFYILDIDGTKEADNTEWAASFAFNGDTFIEPTLTTASSTDLDLLPYQTVASDWQDLVTDMQGSGSIPEDIQLAINRSDHGGHHVSGEAYGDPDNPYTQLLVDYNDTAVTSLYILWGIQRDVSRSADFPQQSAGLTGFSSPTPPAVPDAGATVALLGLALISLAGLQRKFA